MWIYEKKLQYPVKIKNSDPAMAKLIISQLGGPDGELGASMRYLNQRYTMPWGEVVGILNDVGREASEMFQSEKITENSFDKSLFLYSFDTKDIQEPLPIHIQYKDDDIVLKKKVEKTVNVYLGIGTYN